MQINKYNSMNLAPKVVGSIIGELLGDNYPDSYSKESKTHTLSKRDTPEKINDRIRNGVIYITIEDTQNKVFGFLEIKKIRVEGGVYVQLCWLVIDQAFRGKGYATMLHTEFEREAQKIGKDIKGNWCLQLGTGKNNSLARDMYKRWGYEEYSETQTDVFMTKDI